MKKIFLVLIFFALASVCFAEDEVEVKKSYEIQIIQEKTSGIKNKIVFWSGYVTRLQDEQKECLAKLQELRKKQEPKKKD